MLSIFRKYAPPPFVAPDTTNVKSKFEHEYV